MPAQPTVADYLNANKDRIGFELTQEGRAILIALQGVIDKLEDVVEASGGAPTVTPHIFALGASASKTIPSGSKGWSVVFTSGTGTIGGVAVPANFGGDSDNGILAADLVITTDADSSAYIRYNS